MVDYIRELEAERDDPFNAGDPVSVEKQQKKATRLKIESSQVLLNLLSTPHGRAWMSDVLSFCDVVGNPFVCGASDSTAFNCGMQNVGKMLLAQIFEVAPDKYPVMLRESKRRFS